MLALKLAPLGAQLELRGSGSSIDFPAGGARLTASCTEKAAVKRMNVSSGPTDLYLQSPVAAWLTGVLPSCAGVGITTPCVCPSEGCGDDHPPLWYCSWSDSAGNGATLGPNYGYTISETDGSGRVNTKPYIICDPPGAADWKGDPFPPVDVKLTVYHYAPKTKSDSFETNALAIPYEGVVGGDSKSFAYSPPAPPMLPPSPHACFEGGTLEMKEINFKTYGIITFTSSADLKVTCDAEFDMLVVAGGGPGGGRHGGGGGGGGVLTVSGGLWPKGNYKITIGAGGAHDCIGGYGKKGGDTEITAYSGGLMAKTIGGGQGGFYVMNARTAPRALLAIDCPLRAKPVPQPQPPKPASTSPPPPRHVCFSIPNIPRPPCSSTARTAVGATLVSRAISLGQRVALVGAAARTTPRAAPSRMAPAILERQSVRFMATSEAIPSPRITHAVRPVEAQAPLAQRPQTRVRPVESAFRATSTVRKTGCALADTPPLPASPLAPFMPHECACALHGKPIPRPTLQATTTSTRVVVDRLLGRPARLAAVAKAVAVAGLVVPTRLLGVRGRVGGPSARLATRAARTTAATRATTRAVVAVPQANTLVDTAAREARAS